MARIVEYPAVVREALEVFGDLFANEPQRQHFAEYLTHIVLCRGLREELHDHNSAVAVSDDARECVGFGEYDPACVCVVGRECLGRDVLAKEVSTSMTACISCHRQKNARVDCTACHLLGQ